MNNDTLHADHVDETGAYGLRFNVIKELLDSGALSEIPEEFKTSNTNENIPITNKSKFDFTDGHADHVDETGEYRCAWEAQFGVLDDNQPQQNRVGNEWKEFLQGLITEEKNKLNI